MLFLLEEGASYVTQSMAWRALIAAGSCLLTLKFFLSGALDESPFGVRFPYLRGRERERNDLAREREKCRQDLI